MMFGIVSTKFAAILIGPTGVGLVGAYQSITQLGIALSGLGINQSGVRDVTVSAGTRDELAIAMTISILRRMCLLTGLLGAVGLAALAIPVSKLTFGNTEHAFGLVLLFLVILVTAIAQGQMAIIQGLRRISDLVRVQIFDSMVVTLAIISLYSTMGISGVVPSWWPQRCLTLERPGGIQKKILPKSIKSQLQLLRNSKCQLIKPRSLLTMIYSKKLLKSI